MRTSTKKITLAVVSAAALGGLALLTPSIAQAASGGASTAPGAVVPHRDGGTVVRVETDRDGTYEAHVTKTDGTQVEAKVDAAFRVTTVQTRHAGGPGDHMDHRDDAA